MGCVGSTAADGRSGDDGGGLGDIFTAGNLGGFMSFVDGGGGPDQMTNTVSQQQRSGGGPEFDQNMKNTIAAVIRMFSGCADSQTSADVSNVASFGLPSNAGPGGAGGACTNGLMSVLNKNKEPTYGELLAQLRDILKTKGYTQIPQLSGSRPILMTQKFSLRPPAGKPRRALLIGINYVGHNPGELRGCHNDVETMKRFLCSQGWNQNDMKILMDKNGFQPPTKKNIVSHLSWLIDVEPGSFLFLHYSGHGSKVKDTSQDEADRYDETLVPLDFQSAGMVTDDEIFARCVVPCPKDCELNVVLDCCHSGSAMDLPYSLTATEQNVAQIQSGEMTTTPVNQSFNAGKLIGAAFKAYQAYQSGGAMGALGAFAGDLMK